MAMTIRNSRPIFLQMKTSLFPSRMMNLMTQTAQTLHQMRTLHLKVMSLRLKQILSMRRTSLMQIRGLSPPEAGLPLHPTYLTVNLTIFVYNLKIGMIRVIVQLKNRQMKLKRSTEMSEKHQIIQLKQRSQRKGPPRQQKYRWRVGVGCSPKSTR